MQIIITSANIFLKLIFNLGHNPEFVTITDSSQTTLKPNGSLEISSVSKEDEGMYLCNISNGIGTSLEKTIALRVIGTHFKTYNNYHIIKIIKKK